MSGGSYDYLCVKDADELFHMEEQLQRMAARLAGLGYAEDAAMETEDVLAAVRQARVRLNARISRLGRVWRAVEWWDSGDYAEDQVRTAVEEYRESTGG